MLTRRCFLGVFGAALLAAVSPAAASVSHRDDYAYLQGLIDAGGPIVLPPGEYWLSRPLNIRHVNGLYVQGSYFHCVGPEACAFEGDETTRRAWFIGNTFDAGGDSSFVHLS